MLPARSAFRCATPLRSAAPCASPQAAGPTATSPAISGTGIPACALPDAFVTSLNAPRRIGILNSISRSDIKYCVDSGDRGTMRSRRSGRFELRPRSALGGGRFACEGIHSDGLSHPPRHWRMEMFESLPASHRRDPHFRSIASALTSFLVHTILFGTALITTWMTLPPIPLPTLRQELFQPVTLVPRAGAPAPRLGHLDGSSTSNTSAHSQPLHASAQAELQEISQPLEIKADLVEVP